MEYLVKASFYHRDNKGREEEKNINLICSVLLWNEIKKRSRKDPRPSYEIALPLSPLLLFVVTTRVRFSSFLSYFTNTIYISVFRCDLTTFPCIHRKKYLMSFHRKEIGTFTSRKKIGTTFDLCRDMKVRS